MRHVDDHAHPIHLAYNLFTVSGEPAVLSFVTATAKQALVVVGQLHDHKAHAPHNFNESNFVFNRRTVLGAKNDTNLAFFFGPMNVCRLEYGCD